MNKTPIEWVKNPDGTQGFTWNPITGCLNHTDGLCKGGGFPCYAYRLANGRLKQRYMSNRNVSNIYTLSEGLMDRKYNDPFYPRFWEERLDDVKRGYHKANYPNGPVPDAAKPRGIFVCDIGELFGDWIPFKWIKKVFGLMKEWENRNDRFYLLTKQPQNLIKFSPFPPNCWVGVTATDDTMFRIAVNNLRQIQAKIKYISFEPLLNWSVPEWDTLANWLSHISWLIIGAQTKPYKPPKIEWVEEIIGAADKAGIPVFCKDNLKPLFIAYTKSQGQICSDYSLIQEMPFEI